MWGHTLSPYVLLRNWRYPAWSYCHDWVLMKFDSDSQPNGNHKYKPKKTNHMKWCSLLILLHTYYISLHLTTSFYICLHLITSYHILWHIMIHCYILWHIITYYYILSFRISISTFNLYKMHCPVIVFFLYFEFASIICWGCSLNKSSLSNGGTVIPSVHSCSFHSFPV